MDHPLLAPLEADLDALAATPPTDSPVSTCGAWTTTDLLHHVGRVTRYAAACLSADPEEGSPRGVRVPEGADPSEWAATGAAGLLQALRDTPADRVVPTFAGPRPATWWAVRQASEMAVHRVDAQLASGAGVAPVDPVVAGAGIDEWFDLVCGVWKRTELTGFDASVHLHATDDVPAGLPSEWTGRWASGELSWDHSHAKGDLAVRAASGDLLLVLWSRPPVDDVELLGDTALLARLQSATAI
jgi:uncharacterized protein (TIGR03083 family)